MSVQPLPRFSSAVDPDAATPYGASGPAGLEGRVPAVDHPPLRKPSAEERALAFDGLRAEGLRWLQQLSGRAWTDHNLHDPGITLLEQLCFGLGDVVYRSGFPVADHLAGPDHRIDYAALSLHPPDQAFPCRATTLEDYRRLLLDQVSGLDDATLRPIPDSGGVYQLRLQYSADAGSADDEADRSEGEGGHASDDGSDDRNDDDEDAPGGPDDPGQPLDAADPRVARARAVFHAQRNLGEDLAPEVLRIQAVKCDVEAEVEIEGERDAIQILADVYDRCARLIAGEPVSRTLDELLRDGQALEDIYDGPAMERGFIQAMASGRDDGGRLFLSDIANCIRSVTGVFDVRVIAVVPDTPAQRDLALSGGVAGLMGSVVWRDEGWALSLRRPSRRRPPTIRVLRRGHEVRVPLAELLRRLQDLRTAGRALRDRRRADQAEAAAALLPTGRHRDLARYLSVQNHLPAIYGVGRYGTPSSAPPQAQARARQLKAYLVLHEQVIAQSLAHLHHLRELFSINGGSRQTLWSQVIDERQVPGLDALREGSAQDLDAVVYRRLDRGAARKRRVLDHLLALHGETYTQNSMRQFCGHLLPEELEALLLENKAAWLRQIVDLTRHRGGGVHLGKPSWGQVDNGSGLQRRASLLLGFRLSHDRPLTRALREHRVLIASGDTGRPASDAELVAESAAESVAERINEALRRLSESTENAGLGGAADGPPASLLMPVPAELARLGLAVGTTVRPSTREQVLEDLRQFPWLRGKPVAAALLRAAARSDRYRILPPSANPPPPPAIHLPTPTGLAAPRPGEPTPHEVFFAIDRPAVPGYRLVVGPDERNAWRLIGAFPDEAAARRAAASLRLFTQHLEQESEGLHVVEHLLLRPLRGQSVEHQRLRLPPDFFAFRLTVVLPGWTTRTADPDFRRFAEETLRLCAPAHLALRCCWLDLQDMQDFEGRHEQWLETRLALSATPTDAVLQARADEASARLLAPIVSWQSPERVEPEVQGHA